LPPSTLPPLQFLHAIEAASRLGSFRAAADELHLTPSAVSQQIHAVEAALGVPLFTRLGRTVAVTPEGALYCQEVRRTLLELSDAGRRLASRSEGKVLRLTTVDFIAHEFLIPRLPAFQERFPDVELVIETSMRVVDLERSEIDAALRVRGRAGPGLVAAPIGDVTAAIVCSPERARRVQSREDLCSETLLEMAGSPQGAWAELMRSYGFGEGRLRILTLETYFQTVTAAERGVGVAFGLFPMTTQWVRAGRLAVPFKVRAPVDGGVYLAFRPHDKRRELFLAIADFLRSEYAALPALPEGRIVGKQVVARRRQP
jgi:LysR family transcriptional regulator, glycine cleavage system transcriptional activator